MSVCVNHIKWLFSSLAFSTGPQMGRLDFAMNIFIEMFRKYATKEGDRLHLSRKELRDMFNAELCDLLQVVGRQKICCFNMMSSYYIIISFFSKREPKTLRRWGWFWPLWTRIWMAEWTLKSLFPWWPSSPCAAMLTSIHSTDNVVSDKTNKTWISQSDTGFILEFVDFLWIIKINIMNKLHSVL